MFIYQVVTIEKKSPFAAFKQSVSLVNIDVAGAFGYLVLVGLIIGAIALLFSMSGIFLNEVESTTLTAALSIIPSMFGAVFSGVFYAKRKAMLQEENGSISKVETK